MVIFLHPLYNQISFIFTWNCASSKYIEAVQQNSEIDLKTHQIFPYSELLEDFSLELKEFVVFNMTIKGSSFNIM